MSLKKFLRILEKYVIPSYFLYKSTAYIINLKETSSSDYIVIVDNVIKPLFFAILLIFSSNRKQVINPKIFFGILLSYSPIYFFETVTKEYVFLISIILSATLLFYILLIFYSGFSLGKNFGIFPNSNNLVSTGPYSSIKHPLYSCYIHIFIIFTSLNLTLLNLLLLILFCIGIYLRSSEEEKLLTLATDYSSSMSLKPRYFKLEISLPTLIFLIVLTAQTNLKKNHSISINISYPVYSTHPHKVDDWSSFFAINHIFPRIIERNGDFRKNGIFMERSIHCTDANDSPISNTCKSIQFNYQLKDNLYGCNKRKYSDNDFKYELEEILKFKNWILPNFKWCDNNQKCFTFSKVDNIQNNLESIYLRFGWSISKKTDLIFGILPNCLKALEVNQSGEIHDGIISSPNSNIHFSTKNLNADVFLFDNYNTKKNYSKSSYYNPIYFFFIINGKSHRWISKETYTTIQILLKKHHVIENTNPSNFQYINFKSKILSFDNYKKPSTRKIIAIPDYLTNCSKLVKEFEQAMTNQLLDIQFECVNISIFVEKTVKRNKKWDAFISPLTPGLPGKNAFNIQYFNQDSLDSWLGRDRPGSTNVLLIGLTNGSMILKNNKFCGIKPNSLGLSDFTIDDLIECEDSSH